MQNFACDWWPVTYKLYPSGRQSHANCTCAAASRMQTVPARPPVACKLYLRGRQPHANCTCAAASRMQTVPAWPPVASNMNKSTEIRLRLAATRVQLHATSGHSGTICVSSLTWVLWGTTPACGVGGGGPNSDEGTDTLVKPNFLFGADRPKTAIKLN
jgi:hypothetical protein